MVENMTRPKPQKSDLAKLLNQTEAQVAFNKPWELRIFSLAVAASEAGLFEWSAIQEALTDAIRQSEDAGVDTSKSSPGYYTHLMTALEVVLVRSGLLEAEGIDARARDILSHPPHKNHVAKYEPITVDQGAR
jgi:nitrile hydratase accessory protein